MKVLAIIFVSILLSFLMFGGSMFVGMILSDHIKKHDDFIIDSLIVAVLILSVASGVSISLLIF